MDTTKRLKGRVTVEVDARRDQLIQIADTIHANPELGFEEFKAASLLSKALDDAGFSVERGVAGMETAFRATMQPRSLPPKVLRCTKGLAITNSLSSSV